MKGLPPYNRSKTSGRLVSNRSNSLGLLLFLNLGHKSKGERQPTRIIKRKFSLKFRDVLLLYNLIIKSNLGATLNFHSQRIHQFIEMNKSDVTRKSTFTSLLSPTIGSMNSRCGH